VAVEGRGRLGAAEMHLWLDMLPGQPQRSTAATAGPDLSRVRPARLLARGMVEAEGEATDAAAQRVEARSDRLELWFRHATPPAPAAVPAPATVAAAPAPAPPPAPQVVAAAPPPQAPPAAPPQHAAGSVSATASLVRGQITISPRGNEVDEISMEGQVHLVELQAATVAGGPAATPSFEVRGDQLQVSRPTRADARAIVSGRPARIEGRGMDAEGPLVTFERGRNRFAIEGAGRLGLPMAAGAGLESLSLTGSPRPEAAVAGPPGRLDVTWQGRLDFDGQKARFVDGVVAKGGGADLRSGFLDVFFDRPFEFAADARRSGQPQPDVAKIACGGGVRIDSESTDEAGQKSSERLLVQDLTIDRTTGDVTGSGPGRLTSTRVGQPMDMALPAGPQGRVAAPVQPVAAHRRDDQLTFLGVGFQRGLRGNLRHRGMEFHQRVEAIWGPIAKRGDSLDPHAATGLPDGAVLISCEVLGVGQAPPLPGRQRSTIEIAARDNVQVEGESFTARSARLAWSESKDLIVFEGDGRADAQLYRQLKVGAQPQSTSAGKILYWRGLNQVEVQDARYLDLDQLGGGGARMPGGLPAPVRAPLGPPPVPGT